MKESWNWCGARTKAQWHEFVQSVEDYIGGIFGYKAIYRTISDPIFISPDVVIYFVGLIPPFPEFALGLRSRYFRCLPIPSQSPL